MFGSRTKVSIARIETSSGQWEVKSLSRTQITDPKAQGRYDFILRTMNRRVKPSE